MEKKAKKKVCNFSLSLCLSSEIHYPVSLASARLPEAFSVDFAGSGKKLSESTASAEEKRGANRERKREREADSPISEHFFRFRRSSSLQPRLGKTMSALLRLAALDSLRGGVVVSRGRSSSPLLANAEKGRRLSATAAAEQQQQRASAAESSSGKDDGNFTSEDEDGFSPSSSSGPPPEPPSAGVTVAAMGMGGK